MKFNHFNWTVSHTIAQRHGSQNEFLKFFEIFLAFRFSILSKSERQQYDNDLFFSSKAQFVFSSLKNIQFEYWLGTDQVLIITNITYFHYKLE